MTNRTYTECDGCGKDREGKNQFETFYQKSHPNNEAIVKAKHYCPDCEAPDHLLEEHPATQL